MALNPKQRAFVDHYLIDRNAAQAAIRAGYSQRTAKQIGSRLLTHVDVASEIQKRQLILAQKLEITAEKVLRDIEVARQGAIASEQYGAALRASELQGKHIGMWAETAETPTSTAVEDLIANLPELGRHVAFLLARTVQAASKEDPKPLH